MHQAPQLVAVRRWTGAEGLERYILDQFHGSLVLFQDIFHLRSRRGTVRRGVLVTSWDRAFRKDESFQVQQQIFWTGRKA